MRRGCHDRSGKRGERQGQGQYILSIFNQLCVACDNMKHFPAAYVATDSRRGQGVGDQVCGDELLLNFASD